MRIFKKKQTDIPRRRTVQAPDSKPKENPHIFKRNRTMTGTISNRLDGVNPNTDLKSTRTQVHSLSTQRRKIGIVLLVVVLTAILIWVLISSFTANISINITNTGISRPIDKQKYQKVIQDYLNENPFNRLTFFMNQSNFSAYVLSKLPEVSNIIEGNMVGLGTTSFAITMRTPVVGWQIGERQYYVDSNGVPFKVNYFSPPSVQIVDNSGITYKSGTSAIVSNSFLSFVGRIVSIAKTYGFTVIQASLPPNTTREVEIRLKEVSYYVKLSIDRPAGEQVQDMAVAIRYFTNSRQTPKYIDVRVSGKAFYK